MRRYGDVHFSDKIATIDSTGIVRFVDEMPPLDKSPFGTVVVLAKTQYGYKAGGIYWCHSVNGTKVWDYAGQMTR